MELKQLMPTCRGIVNTYTATVVGKVNDDKYTNCYIRTSPAPRARHSADVVNAMLQSFRRLQLHFTANCSDQSSTQASY